MKTAKNKVFLTTPNAMGRSVAVKPPVTFQKANKIDGFVHISYGTALKNYLYGNQSQTTYPTPGLEGTRRTSQTNPTTAPAKTVR